MDSVVGGGVVAQIFRHLPERARFSGGRGGGSGRIFSVNCSNRPSIRVIQTCIVFCPNNVDSLPELMSTNCPNWGATAPRPVRLCLPPITGRIPDKIFCPTLACFGHGGSVVRARD